MPTVAEVFDVIALDAIIVCLWWCINRWTDGRPMGFGFWISLAIFNLIPCGMLALVWGMLAMERAK